MLQKKEVGGAVAVQNQTAEAVTASSVPDPKICAGGAVSTLVGGYLHQIGVMSGAPKSGARA
jgi:hypothetical protein